MITKFRTFENYIPLSSYKQEEYEIGDYVKIDKINNVIFKIIDKNIRIDYKVQSSEFNPDTIYRFDKYDIKRKLTQKELVNYMRDKNINKFNV